MANEIVRKELYKGLGNIKKVEVWLKAAESLGFRVCRGGKHPSTVRNSAMPEDNSTKSLIATIPNNLHRNMNQIIFKEMLRSGMVSEDELWKALGFIKEK